MDSAAAGYSSYLTAMEPTARNCDPAALMMAFWSSSTCSGCLASISSCMLGGRALGGSFRLMQKNGECSVASIVLTTVLSAQTQQPSTAT
jgi:hypothetical protein